MVSSPPFIITLNFLTSTLAAVGGLHDVPPEQHTLASLSLSSVVLVDELLCLCLLVTDTLTVTVYLARASVPLLLLH